MSSSSTLLPAVDADALFAAITHRRSMGLSKLKPDPIDHSLIEKILEAANWAPSNEDTEPWRFTVFSGEGREVLADLNGDAYRESAGDKFDEEKFQANRMRAYAAPVWISVAVAPGLNEDGSPVNSIEEELMAVACAAQNLHLMASALGIAGMWHSKGLSVNPTVARGLGVTGSGQLLGFFMLGWPNAEWATCGRIPLSEKVRWVESRS